MSPKNNQSPPVTKNPSKGKKKGSIPTSYYTVDNFWKVAILLFMVASLYLQNNYITKDDHADLNTRVHAIERVLSQLEVKNEVDVRQTKALDAILARLIADEKALSKLEQHYLAH